MSLANKIKISVEKVTGLPVIYYDKDTINRELENTSLPCAFFYLLSNTEILQSAGQNIEKAEVAVFFVNRTDFDFNSLENEKIIEDCKKKANTWLRAVSHSKDVKISDGSKFTAERVYNEFDAIVTGVAVRVTLEELYGFNACKDSEFAPTQILQITKNGEYDVKLIDLVKIDIKAKWGEIGGYLKNQSDLDNALSEIDSKAEKTRAEIEDILPLIYAGL